MSGCRCESGVVDAREVFSMEAFCNRLGITRDQVTRMKSRGLKVRKDERYVAILGSDYIEYVRALPQS